MENVLLRLFGTKLTNHKTIPADNYLSDDYNEHEVK